MTTWAVRVLDVDPDLQGRRFAEAVIEALPNFVNGLGQVHYATPTGVRSRIGAGQVGWMLMATLAVSISTYLYVPAAQDFTAALRIVLDRRNALKAREIAAGDCSRSVRALLGNAECVAGFKELHRANGCRGVTRHHYEAAIDTMLELVLGHHEPEGLDDL